ncbi:hypothetical protein [Streptomyces marincola]|uniref:Uncharacterized protein n=1 Tax=Streptomyces marincola TaxID=2878388 RepID=A0A1W7CWG4_9ACTN|nr:hypothetical protein [Streptomyces marincola]ARQ69163.1 hypothetical protein CAG99_10075 [Streptomyces marincola]
MSHLMRDLRLALWEAVAVQIPRYLAAPAMQRLVGEPGPVLVDAAGRAVYFFVPADTCWAMDDTTAVPASSLTLPPRTRVLPPGRYWLVRPDDQLRLADPAALSTALSMPEQQWAA